MAKFDKHNEFDCKADCPQCPEAGQGEGDGAGVLIGWRLTLAAGGVFLMPLILAIVGASVAGTGQVAKFLGAGAGFGVGVVAAIITGRVVRRSGREAA